MIRLKLGNVKPAWQYATQHAHHFQDFVFKFSTGYQRCCRGLLAFSFSFFHVFSFFITSQTTVETGSTTYRCKPGIVMESELRRGRGGKYKTKFDVKGPRVFCAVRATPTRKLVCSPPPTMSDAVLRPLRIALVSHKVRNRPLRSSQPHSLREIGRCMAVDRETAGHHSIE